MLKLELLMASTLLLPMITSNYMWVTTLILIVCTCTTMTSMMLINSASYIMMTE